MDKSIKIAFNSLIFILCFSFANANTGSNRKSNPAPNLKSLNEGQMTYFLEDKYKTFSLENIDGVTFADGCKSKKCNAYFAIKNKLSYPESKQDGAFNPGAAYCVKQGGKVMIAIDKSSNQYDYCRFKDGSMVDSWSLLFSHYPKKVIN